MFMKPSLGSLLIVDDNEANRDMLSRRLERRGYTTTMVENGQQALQAVQSKEFDVILLDVMMPDMNGLEVLKILRLTYDPDALPVIMVTAKDESSDIVTALEYGANDYITKPIDFAVACARIRNQVRHKQARIALQESEERYALAVRGANDGLWDWNLDTNEVYFSPRWKTMLGCSEDEVEHTMEAWFNRVHPQDRDPLEAAIIAHLHRQTPHFECEHRISHKDGTYRWVLCRGVAIHNAEGKALRMAGSQTDITERKIADALTGLPNRLLFMDRLERAITRAKRRPQYLFAVLLLDLDRFKMINEGLGHGLGDELLIAIAHRLENYLRSCSIVTRFGETPTLARFGGDEFVVLLDDIHDINDATRVAERLQEQLTAPFLLNEHEVFISASLGIALSTTGYDHSGDLLRDADTAMYRAKARGKARHEIFDTDMHARAVARLQVETALRWAVEREEFLVFYQPVIHLPTGCIRSFEALLRWHHPHRGIVSPTEFIPIAEENGLIIPMGWWILREACRQMHLWQQQFPEYEHLSISVNLSGKQFAQPDLVKRIARTLQETGLLASSLKLEVTESVLIDNATAADMLRQLRDMGIQLSMDDFGTGYSSLSYLYRFPMQFLKIDQAFIARMGTGRGTEEMVRTIITMGHDLGMQVIAEGVETAEHLATLRALGCEYAQGFLFSHPAEAHTMAALLAEHPQW